MRKLFAILFLLEKTDGSHVSENYPSTPRAFSEPSELWESPDPIYERLTREFETESRIDRTPIRSPRTFSNSPERQEFLESPIGVQYERWSNPSELPAFQIPVCSPQYPIEFGSSRQSECWNLEFEISEVPPNLEEHVGIIPRNFNSHQYNIWMKSQPPLQEPSNSNLPKRKQPNISLSPSPKDVSNAPEIFRKPPNECHSPSSKVPILVKQKEFYLKIYGFPRVKDFKALMPWIFPNANIEKSEFKTNRQMCSMAVFYDCYTDLMQNKNYFDKATLYFIPNKLVHAAWLFILHHNGNFLPTNKGCYAIFPKEMEHFGGLERISTLETVIGEVRICHWHRITKGHCKKGNSCPFRHE